MNHFIISYAGNKRNEYKYFKDIIQLDNIKNIIEPFCGSGAISFNIWKEYGDKFNYYLNDNDEMLIKLYNLMKNETIETIELEINKIKNSIKNKEDYLSIFKKKDHTIYEYIYFNRYRSIRLGLYDEKRCHSKSDFKFNKTQLDFIKFIKEDYVYITNDDWIEIFDKYKDDSNSLFMFDPPYLMSCNEFYSQKKSFNVYEYFFNNKIDKYNSKIYFILEDIWIIRLLFKNFIISNYEKMYGITKKQTSHIIIGNVK